MRLRAALIPFFATVLSVATSLQMANATTARSCPELFRPGQHETSPPSAVMNRLPLLAMKAELSKQRSERGILQTAKDTWIIGRKVLPSKRVGDQEVLVLGMNGKPRNFPISQLLSASKLLELTQGQRAFPRELLVQFPVAQFFANLTWMRVPVIGMIGNADTMKGENGPSVTAYYAVGESGHYLVEAAFLPMPPYEHVGLLLRSRTHNDNAKIIEMITSAAAETREKYPEFRAMIHPIESSLIVSAHKYVDEHNAAAVYVELADVLGTVQNGHLTVDPVTGEVKALEIESPNTLFLKNLFKQLVQAP